MKKSRFVHLIALCGASLIICSYVGGASTHSIEGTGAETGLGNSAGCGQGCHTSGTAITISLELDSAGTPTTRYVPGMSYKIKLTGKNTSTTSLPKFGFQIGSIVGSTSAVTPVNAGVWNAPFPVNTKYIAPKAGKFVVGIVEQTLAIAATSGTGGNGTTYEETFNWTAPASGTGTISFWAAINAVNGNGSDTGDKYSTAHVAITELVPTAALKIITTTVNVKCNGDKTGTATATITGGTKPYTYSWNSIPVQTTATATGLASGNYAVNVKDAAGASVSGLATISQPTALIINTTAVNASSCTVNDGSITSSVSGGKTPYTYAWSNGKTISAISGLAAGTYSLTLTDANNCKQSTTTTVNCTSASLTVTVNAANITCFGSKDGSATALASGTPPYSYSWNTTPAQNAAKAVGLAEGPYTVTVKDATGATKSVSVTITSPAALLANLTTTSVSSCSASDGSITSAISGGITPYTYLWSNGLATNSISGLDIGSYTLNVTDANGCQKIASASVTLSSAIPIGISTPLTEGFENSTNLPSGWTLDNPNNDAEWQIVTTVSHTGSNSIGFDNCDGNGAGADMTGTKDRFVTGAYDFTNTTSTANLSFNIAYAVLKYKNQTRSDSLAIYSSTDCGGTWNLLYLKGGANLSDISTSISCWTPTAADWKTENIALTALAGKPNVIFAFENRSNWGEWLYIDNINITAVTGIETMNPLATFNVYPNPASTLFTIEGTSTTDKIHYTLYNIIGIEIKSGEIRTDGNFFSEKIPVTDFSRGMYFIKLSDKKNTCTKKLKLK
ncbi:MAG: T9SS type A sorting domain-containing protein [Bacteroidia bacterium]